MKNRMIVDRDGTKWWYKDGHVHREDGPAIERANGDKEWRLNGVRHRVDGPAREDADGSKEWYISGVRVTEQDVIKLQSFTQET